MFEQKKNEMMSVVFSTSSYAGLTEADNIVDGSRKTFWASSGIYPQQLIISLPGKRCVSTIDIRCYMVKTVVLENSVSEKPEGFQFVAEKELEVTENIHQKEVLFNGEMESCHLRIIVKSGYDHVCAVYKIDLDLKEGDTLAGNIKNVLQQDTENIPISSRDFTEGPRKFLPSSVSPPLQRPASMSRPLAPLPEQQPKIKSTPIRNINLRETSSSDEEF